MGHHVVDPDGVRPAPGRLREERSISEGAGVAEPDCNHFTGDEP